MAKKNEDRQFNSRKQLTIVGNVLENKLKVEEYNGVNVIKGKIVVKCGEKDTQVVTLDMYTSETYSTGNENKSYTKSLDTINNLVTLSKATPENPASVIVISGNNPAFSPSIEIEKFWDKEKEEFKSIVKAKVGFASLEINDNLTEKDFRSEFEIDVVPVGDLEYDEDGTTLIIKGAIVDYKGGYHIMTFKSVEEEFVEGISELEGLDSFETLREICEDYKGQKIPFEVVPQLRLWGDASLANITVREEKKSMYGGKGRVVETSVFTSDLMVTGAEPSKIYDVHALMTAVDNNEEYEAELRNKAENKKAPTSKKTKGFKANTDNKPTKRRGNF